jgi:capsular exopolysaccharide synthesis family protein
MSSNPYILPLIKWWRLIAVVTLLAVGVSTISTMLQPDIYESKTTLVVGTTFLNPNPDSGQLLISQQLAGIYADMASREPIQNATKAALGINWLPQYRSRVIPLTQMIEISVADTNPKRAQIIANELANQLKLQTPTFSKTEAASSQDFIAAQLSSLQTQIQATDKNIQDLQKSLVGLNSASQIASIQKQISQQTDKLTTLRANYTSFLANSQGGAVNILSVVEPANLPSSPTGTNKFFIVFLAGLVGFGLGTGAAYLLEYLDRTIKSTSDVERIFNLPVIGYISEVSDDSTSATSVVKNPDSILAENFRLLRSNVEFYRISNPAKTIMITSPSQGTGKTTVATNLALSISQEGGDVILVDADLRRPAVHTYLEMTRQPGLSDVTRNGADPQSVVRQWNGEGSLKVITAGDTHSETTPIAGSKGISAVLSSLKQCHDLVIVDSPPLIISDSFNLASAADAVILVMEPGVTPEEQAKAIKEQLGRANAKILGIVFNKVSEESASSRYDYQYRSLYSPKYYGDYTSKTIKEPATSSRSKKLLDFFERGRVSVNIEKAAAAKKTPVTNLLNRLRKSKGEGKS